MEIFTTIKDIRNKINEWKKNNYSIGLVPTMGYLHNGHGSLISQSIKDNDKTIVSIFVNPTQFGVGEDLEKYPRDIERDKLFLDKLKVDAIFNPSVEEMYSKNSLTTVYVDNMSSILCGKTRPTHFQGVTTVVTKLFNITNPDKAYFGSKDFQQLQIIKRMVKDLNFNIEIVGMPIVREIDGLALSSRNVYLNDEERKSALLLNRALNNAKELFNNGQINANEIIKETERIISNEKNTKIDYINVVDIDTLDKVDIINRPVVMLLAVYVGNTRLIDNTVINL